MKNLSGALLLLVGMLWLVALSGAASAATQYRVTDLGILPNGNFSVAYGINNLGQVVGCSNAGPDINHAFLWDNGVMQDLGTLGGDLSYALGINDSGQIAGWSWRTPSGGDGAFLWENGVMRELGNLPNHTASNAHAINASGQVVGESRFGNDACLWENGAMRDLGDLPGGSSSCANSINAWGQVVGYAHTTPYGYSARAFLWQNDVMSDLGTLGGLYSEANAVNDAGQVVGYANTTAGDKHAFLWADGAMQDLGTLGNASSVARDINNLGQVVGSTDSCPFLWENGTMYNLRNLLTPSDSEWHLGRANAINDRGQIVGVGYIDESGLDHAILLTPVPEPSTLMLLACGLPIVAMRRLRRR